MCVRVFVFVYMRGGGGVFLIANQKHQLYLGQPHVSSEVSFKSITEFMQIKANDECCCLNKA